MILFTIFSIIIIAGFVACVYQAFKLLSKHNESKKEKRKLKRKVSSDEWV